MSDRTEEPKNVNLGVGSDQTCFACTLSTGCELVLQTYVIVCDAYIIIERYIVFV